MAFDWDYTRKKLQEENNSVGSNTTKFDWDYTYNALKSFEPQPPPAEEESPGFFSKVKDYIADAGLLPGTMGMKPATGYVSLGKDLSSTYPLAGETSNKYWYKGSDGKLSYFDKSDTLPIYNFQDSPELQSKAAQTQQDYNALVQKVKTENQQRFDKLNPVLKVIDKFGQAGASAIMGNKTPVAEFGNKFVDVPLDIAGNIAGFVKNPQTSPSNINLLKLSNDIYGTAAQKLANTGFAQKAGTKIAQKLEPYANTAIGKTANVIGKYGSKGVEGAGTMLPFETFAMANEGNFDNAGERYLNSALLGFGLGAGGSAAVDGLKFALPKFKNVAIGEDLNNFKTLQERMNGGSFRPPQTADDIATLNRMDRQVYPAGNPNKFIPPPKPKAEPVPVFPENKVYPTDNVSKFNPNVDEIKANTMPKTEPLKSTPTEPVKPKLNVDELTDLERSYYDKFERNLLTQDDLKKLRDEWVNERGNLFEEQMNYLNSKASRGNKPNQGSLHRDAEGNVVGRSGRTSNNELWYQEWSKANRTWDDVKKEWRYRKPTQQELKEIAEKQLTEGFGSIHGSIKKNDYYIGLRNHIDAIDSLLNKLEANKPIPDNAQSILKGTKVESNNSSLPTQNEPFKTPANENVTTAQKYTSDTQKQLDNLTAKYRQDIDNIKSNKSIDSEMKSKQIRSTGEQYSARKREIIQGDSLVPVDGGLTPKELANKIARMQSNYSGKPVITPDGEGVATGQNSFGKVGVKVNGEVKYYPKEQVKAKENIGDVIKKQQEVTQKATKPAETQSNIESPVVKNEPVKTENKAKEPWQMTRDEFMKTPIKAKQTIEEAEISFQQFKESKGVKLPTHDILLAEAVGGRSAFPSKAEKGKLNAARERLALHDKLFKEYEDAIKTGKIKQTIKEVEKDVDVNYVQGSAEARAQHRRSVVQALKEGKPVSKEVLNDYPELAQKYAATQNITPKMEASEPLAESTPIEPPTTPPTNNVAADKGRFKESAVKTNTMQEKIPELIETPEGQKFAKEFEATYEKKPDKESIAKANEMLTKDYVGTYNRIMEKGIPTKEDNLAAWKITRDLLANKNFDEASELITKVRPIITEYAQIIQSMSAVPKDSLEGLAINAKKIVDSYSKKVLQDNPELAKSLDQVSTAVQNNMKFLKINLQLFAENLDKDLKKIMGKLYKKGYIDSILKVLDEGGAQSKQVTKSIKQGYAAPEISPKTMEKIANAIKEKYGVPSFGADDLEKISNLYDKLKSVDKKSWDYRATMDDIDDVIRRKMPKTISDKLSTYQFINLYLNTLTPSKILGGNITSVGMTHVKDMLKHAIDKALPGKTVTEMPSIATKGKSFWKGAKETWKDYRNEVDTDPFIQSYDIDMKHGLTFQNKFMREAEKLTKFVLGIMERPFKQATYDDELRMFMKKENVSEPTEEMLDVAINKANQVMFADKNKSTNVVENLRGGINDATNTIFNKIPGVNIKDTRRFGLGNLIQPVIKTPINMAKAAVNYSPISPLFSKSREEFVDRMAKAIIGSVFGIGTGYVGKKAGFISGGLPKDKDARNFSEEAGRQPYALNMFGKSFDVSYIQPLGMLVSFGAELATEQKDKSTLAPFVAAMDSLINQGMLQGFAKLLGKQSTYTGSMSENMVDAVTGGATTMVPFSALQNQISKSIDPYKRNISDDNALTRNLVKSTANRTLLRYLLPEKVSTTGEKIKEDSWYNIWAFPGKVRDLKDDRVTNELLRLYDDSKENKQFPTKISDEIKYKTSKNGETLTFKLTPKDLVNLQTKLGQKDMQEIEKTMNTYRYKIANDKLKADLLSGKINKIKQKLETEILKSKGIKEYKSR